MIIETIAFNLGMVLLFSLVIWTYGKRKGATMCENDYWGISWDEFNRLSTFQRIMHIFKRDHILHIIIVLFIVVFFITIFKDYSNDWQHHIGRGH